MRFRMPRSSTANIVRLALAAVTSFMYFAGPTYGDSACSLDTLLNVQISPGNISLPSGCSLLGSSGQPILLNTNLTIRGDQNRTAFLDTDWLSGAVTLAPGTALTLENLRLLNVRFGQGFSLLAFNTSQLTLNSVTIETDCRTLGTLITGFSPPKPGQGPAYIYIRNNTFNTVRFSSVNITCRLPVAVDVEHFIVGDSLELYNVLAMYATNVSAYGRGNNLIIVANQNITISPALWKYGSPLFITRNVTLRGALNAYNILDLQAVINAVGLGSRVMFTLENFVIVNAGALRGTLIQLGLLPCFSIPVWFFQFPRIPASPQLTLANCTLLLPPSEYKYFTLWTLLATTVVHMDEAGLQLRASTVAINAKNGTNETLQFERLTGSGLDLVNVNLTYIVRAVPYSGLVLDNPVLIQSFGATPNATLLPIYDLSDLMATLGAMQASPIAQGVALAILRNITIYPEVWPPGGYNVTLPLLMVGQSSAGDITWIDFRRVQNFVRVLGCLPDVYIYIQDLHLVNLPNGLLHPEGSPLAGAPAAAAKAQRLSDVTLFLTNLGVDMCGSGIPSLFLNSSTLVITYTEFRLVHNAVMQSVGTSSKGSDMVVGSQFHYDIGTIVSDNMHFRGIVGWAWNGTNVDLTYMCPTGPPLMYNNVYEPLGESSTGSNRLRWWQIVLIAVGGALFVALIASLIAWRSSVNRLRHEVETVKSAHMDKKSSDASADQDTASAGGRLGSSHVGGGGGGTNQLVGGSPVGPKGSPIGGGGAGGGGTSDDSTAAQYDRPPLEVLNSMMASLTQEMDDQHLTILEVIGQGGFGVVYRGIWKGLNVAVKTITFQDRVAGGEKAQHRAILEAAISSSLSHPNVVTTYSYDIKPLTVQVASDPETPDCCQGPANGQNGGGGGGMKIIDKRPILDWKLYLIQEYCDGGSLRTAILKRKFFDAKKGEPRMEMILDTSLELTGGLVHLHERNIIHGDLNPNNVLLKRDSSKKYGAVCKIADFGLSIKMSADQSHISNMRRGTPFYTCPQILSRGNMTKAADVYSMGVMMWEMYHCCMSYRSLPSGFAARENFPNFPRKAAHDFASLVGSCLDSEPSRRPTFAQLRSELEAQLLAFKRGGMRTGEDVLGPDPSGDAAHLAGCQD
ncbi:hypothetical protein Vretimale_3044 [Volvox reticuliferus]|uniref:Protein kinase domain-containing protein n=1 Tax=Volvox reticuliferus TaxID=1737510 RepID=A0A8J4DDH8_9CHLO|nr:hypothetical protein Vretifemale_6763 [Volvox reticuliferus]GIL97406.1 hypothetical protein Vretimale_3044 [Volvox reticuliferus]